jgi:hypothetical protein
MNDADPPRGSMYLYDRILPPTLDGNYKMTIKTDITYENTTQSAPVDRFFEVVGPRFTLDPTVVANVYPPRNGQGAYQDALPQVVLKRRTLPWERTLSKADENVPWLALLLFEENEYTIYQNQHLEDVVPHDVFKALDSPQNILCDAVEADEDLVRSIMPIKEELGLLAHVRQVNVQDRELNAGSSDGFFSVVMSNRLPAPDTKCRACLVSVEGRTDLVGTEAPPFEYPGGFFVGDVGGIVVGPLVPAVVHEGVAGAPVAPAVIEAGVSLTNRPITPGAAFRLGADKSFIRPLARLVLLHSWQFTVTGPGTFKSLMQRLNVGMIGKPQAEGRPPLTDTGHLRLPILDRAGETETAWYRGPLVPWQLTRDPSGPYHSADQCRRAATEAGAEDISYAAAFEVGRQLAASDARLAQELMRWRRESYRQSARADTIGQIQKAIKLDLPPTLAEGLQVALPPLVSVSAATTFVAGAPAVADRFGLNTASKTAGMDPQTLSQTWGLASADAARAILGGDPGTLGATVAPPPQTPRPDATLDQVAGDAASLNRLSSARDRLLQNAAVRVSKEGGQL